MTIPPKIDKNKCQLSFATDWIRDNIPYDMRACVEDNFMRLIILTTVTAPLSVFLSFIELFNNKTKALLNAYMYMCSLWLLLVEKWLCMYMDV